MSLLEVTGEHVKALDDKQLRDLVERLCNAESRRLGLPLHALTDGGHQNAADGGVDVRIELPHGADAVPGMDFIRRAHTVFQCKAADMPAQAITKEMKPGGVLRPVIAELIRQRGAYIIVSSTGTVADPRLTDRKQAMRACVAGLASSQDLLLDFYDRKRLARWAAQYPDVAAWVREKAGQPIDGWKAHGEWAAPRDKHTPYLADTHPRLWTEVPGESGALQPIVEGVRRMRDTLARERGVARLVGLSGTGKTRLAQALFEPDLDPDAALDRAMVLYADLADDGRDRLAFLTRLQAGRQRAIIVLDNCPPDQHQRFADLCAAEGSRLSLLTINLDVQDDQPEGTRVFKLEGASTEVTERIVRSKPAHAHMRPETRQRIAELAGGNARLALALARSAPNGTLAKFSDADLFNRLFQQGGSRREDLLRTARAVALVYSFDGGSGGNAAEVSVLAGWAGTDVNTLRDHVAELHRRGLVQRRDVWRAVLPQALALHLAREALETRPPHVLEESLRDAPKRLMRSFTRQLGHLHDSAPAKALVQRWLAPVNDMPRDIAACDAEQLIWFANIAPVDPSGALSAMERIAMPRWSQIGVLSDLCGALAYDEDLFPRATALLARWCAEPKNHHELEVFQGLFQVRLSGTLAQIDTRLRTMQALLDDKDGPGHQLGVEALGALLRAGNLSGHPRHSFGARVRDFGLWPVNEQFDDWYMTILKWIAERANGPLRGLLRARVASALPDLCRHVGRPLIAKALASCVAGLSTGSVWPEAWVAVSKVLRRMEISARTESANAGDGKPEPQALACLEHLEALLRPAGLMDEVRTYAMTQQWEINYATAQLLSGDAFIAKAAELDGYAFELGRALTERPDDLATLLPELVANRRADRRMVLGRGLSMGCTCCAQRRELWARMVAMFTTIAPERRNIDLLCGFVQGVTEHERALGQDLLDAAVTHPALGPCLPALQKAGAPIGSTGAKRLIRSAAQGLAPAEAFDELHSGDAIATIPVGDFAALLGVLAEQDNGICVAANLLFMRMLADKQCGDNDPLLPSFGRQILERICLACQQTSSCHWAAELVKGCLAAQGQPDPTLHALAQRIALAMRDQFTQRRGTDDMGRIIEALLLVQPTAALDVLFGFGNEQQASDYWDFFVADNAPPAWLNKVPDDVLVNWVRADPAARAPRIAAACRLMQGESDIPSTWPPLALRLIGECPDRVAVLDQFVSRFIPRGGQGSRAAIVEQRLALLAEFCNDSDPAVATWARSRDAKLRGEIDAMREEEKHWERQRQRFEE